MIDLDTVAGSLHSTLLYLEAVRSAIPAGQTVSKLSLFRANSSSRAQRICHSANFFWLYVSMKKLRASRNISVLEVIECVCEVTGRDITVQSESPERK
jgi:hypothetical protein